MLEISPTEGEIPTFPQLRPRGRMEKWKTKPRFPTFPPPRFLSLKNKKPTAGELRPRPQRHSRVASVVPFSSAPVVSYHSALDRFTETGTNSIGRITTDGVITEYPTPTPSSYPLGIVAGPDGALWFTEHLVNKIGRITTAGAITEYPANAPNQGYPEYITAGPDGALWFADNAGAVWRMTTTGAFTEYPVPLRPSGGGTGWIAVGPDGALWFTVSCSPCANGWIGRITTSGVITEFPEPTSGFLGGIAAGPDGNLWFTDTGFALQIHSAILSAPACALGLRASYTGTTLETSFDLGIDRPAHWNVILQHKVGLEAAIAPVVPPRAFTLDWTVPFTGNVLIKSELSTSTGQVICAEWTTVNIP